MLSQLSQGLMRALIQGKDLEVNLHGDVKSLKVCWEDVDDEL